jgi:hypothetical protein
VTRQPKEPSKWTGLVVLLAIAAGVWFFTQRSSSTPTRRFASVEPEGPEPEPEEEEEEEADDDGDDEGDEE